MTGTKPTPGPWVYAPTGQVMSGYSQPFAVAEQGKANLVCGCFGDVSGGNPVAEANARAIAAVPELIKALNRLEHCASAAALWMTHHPAPGMGDKRDPLALAITEARAALAKALEP